jgi:Uma2 family endonuclease
LSIEQFEDRLFDGDRWIELTEGRLVRLEPPDDIHGDVVRNLAKPLAAYLKSIPDIYACFELPLIISTSPPTVRCPAVSCFQSTNRFAESDKVMTDSIPLLVVEVASTNERRDAMSRRVKEYLDRGVKGIWIIDPVTKHVHVFYPPSQGLMLKQTQMLVGSPVLPDFQIQVSDLFQQPKWDRS